MNDSRITITVDQDKGKIALAALNYIYGNISIETWVEMLEHNYTPPLPLEKHLRD